MKKGLLHMCGFYTGSNPLTFIFFPVLTVLGSVFPLPASTKTGDWIIQSLKISLLCTAFGTIMQCHET